MGTFTIRIPDSWQSYELSGEELAARRAAVLDATPEADLRSAVNRSFRELRAMLDGARRRGAVCAAGTVTRYDDGVLVANVAVFLLRSPRGRPSSIACWLTPSAGPLNWFASSLLPFHRSGKSANSSRPRSAALRCWAALRGGDSARTSTSWISIECTRARSSVAIS